MNKLEGVIRKIRVEAGTIKGSSHQGPECPVGDRCHEEFK